MAITSLFKSRKAPPSSREAGLRRASQPSKINLTPLVSEKGVDRQVLNQVVFRVTAHSTKGQISQAVQEEYGVRPIKVRTIRMHPKRRTRGRTKGFTTQWKKAYVTVADLKPFNVTP